MAADLLKIRAKIERSKDKNNYTEKEMFTMTSAYKEITGTYPPTCASCDIVFTILRNWFLTYDTRVTEPIKKVLKPLKKAPTPTKAQELKAHGQMKVAELKNLAKAEGLKLPHNATKANLIQLING
tara:strand:+ start:2136 stop:2513 length:378 start_codon:yes stop_codon:yes gene_type:complete